MGLDYQHPLGAVFRGLSPEPNAWTARSYTAFTYTNVAFYGKAALTDPEANYQYFQQAYAIVDGGVGIRTDDSDYSFTLWVKKRDQCTTVHAIHGRFIDSTCGGWSFHAGTALLWSDRACVILGVKRAGSASIALPKGMGSKDLVPFRVDIFTTIKVPSRDWSWRISTLRVRKRARLTY